MSSSDNSHCDSTVHMPSSSGSNSGCSSGSSNVPPDLPPTGSETPYPPSLLSLPGSPFRARSYHRCNSFIRGSDPSPLQDHHISMYFDQRWLDLRPLEEVCEREGDPVSSLDVQVLFERLLRPMLDIECPRTDHRMIYVCGSEGAEGLENRVRGGLASVAFCVPRVSVSDIMRVADAGQLMPPKATCFNPKPLSGLLVRLC